MRLRFAVVIFAVSSLALAAERQGAGRCELSSGGCASRSSSARST